MTKRITRSSFSRERENSSVKETPPNQDSTNSDDHGLTPRKDVLFKNIFRSAKKHYATLFKNSTTFFKNKKKTVRRKLAMEVVSQFVRSEFIEKDVAGIFLGISFDDLCMYVGRTVIPEYYLKGFCSYD